MHGKTTPHQPREVAAMCLGAAVLCFGLGIIGAGMRLLGLSATFMETFFVISGFYVIQAAFAKLALRKGKSSIRTAATASVSPHKKNEPAERASLSSAA